MWTYCMSSGTKQTWTLAETPIQTHKRNRTHTHTHTLVHKHTHTHRNYVRIPSVSHLVRWGGPRCWLCLGRWANWNGLGIRRSSFPCRVDFSPCCWSCCGSECSCCGCAMCPDAKFPCWFGSDWDCGCCDCGFGFGRCWCVCSRGQITTTSAGRAWPAFPQSATQKHLYKYKIIPFRPHSEQFIRIIVTFLPT